MRLLVVATALLATAMVLPASGSPLHPAQAVDPGSDLPVGFTDGVPVGGEEGPGAPDSDPEATPSPGTRAVTQRYFGRDPWNAIEASAAATPRSCSLSDNGLTALTVSPVFKESSAATTAATAPSPMTLSRYDEWSGVMADNTNQNANYGLYAFRNPSTAYPRAYWHPGIGIWQYDTAGVGAPFTAIERMDVSIVSADVAAGMAARYCSPSPSLIGHSAPFTGQERRNAAWSPWGYPCTLCEQEFQAMTGSGTPFANINLVSGISTTGGAKARTCSLAGVEGTLPCWYVDPSIGVIEGATAWATVNPGGGSPTVAPAPLSEPFYVLERNGREERHWLAADTGYSIDISGTRQLGKNDRPRSNQTGSGVTWTASTGLCDITAMRGACVPTAPPGLSTTLLSVNGTYRPIALDVEGDGNGDVLWYAPGATLDPLWKGQGSGAFASTNLNIGGSYDVVRVLDVDGDDFDDILWYQPSTGGSYLWHGVGDGTFTAIKLTVGKNLKPVIADRDGDSDDEILWYGPGSLSDAWWNWNGSSFTASSRTISGTFLPIEGDFDANGRGDIFWYAPGPAADALWLHLGTGGVRNVPVSVSGLFKTVVGDYDGDDRDDIFWYAPGSASDSLWFGNGGAFTRVPMTVSTSYQPFVADLEGDGRDDVIWYLPGTGRDPWWRWNSGRALSGSEVRAPGSQVPVVGAFSAGGTDGVLWYGSGSALDAVWWH